MALNLLLNVSVFRKGSVVVDFLVEYLDDLSDAERADIANTLQQTIAEEGLDVEEGQNPLPMESLTLVTSDGKQGTFTKFYLLH